MSPAPTLPFGLLQSLLFVFDLLQFEYDMLTWGFSWGGRGNVVVLCWSSLGFLGLWFVVCQSFWKVLSHYSNISFAVSSISSPSIPIMLLYLLNFSCGSFRFCSVFFLIFLCTLVWEVSIGLSSSSLILYLAMLSPS